MLRQLITELRQREGFLTQLRQARGEWLPHLGQPLERELLTTCTVRLFAQRQRCDERPEPQARCPGVLRELALADRLLGLHRDHSAAEDLADPRRGPLAAAV